MGRVMGSEEVTKRAQGCISCDGASSGKLDHSDGVGVHGYDEPRIQGHGLNRNGFHRRQVGLRKDVILLKRWQVLYYTTP